MSCSGYYQFKYIDVWLDLESSLYGISGKEGKGAKATSIVGDHSELP
jgi:hypothetical protein